MIRIRCFFILALVSAIAACSSSELLKSGPIYPFPVDESHPDKGRFPRVQYSVYTSDPGGNPAIHQCSLINTYAWLDEWTSWITINTDEGNGGCSVRLQIADPNQVLGTAIAPIAEFGFGVSGPKDRNQCIGFNVEIIRRVLNDGRGLGGWYGSGFGVDTDNSHHGPCRIWFFTKGKGHLHIDFKPMPGADPSQCRKGWLGDGDIEVLPLPPGGIPSAPPVSSSTPQAWIEIDTDGARPSGCQLRLKFSVV